MALGVVFIMFGLTLVILDLLKERKKEDKKKDEHR